MHENVSAIHQSAFSALCMTKWRKCLLLDLKLLLGVQSKINKRFCRTWSAERDICLPFSEVWTCNKKVVKYTQKRNLSGKFDWRGCGWSPLCYRMGQFKQQQDHSAFCPFRVWHFPDSRNFNYAINAGRFTSSIWNFWRWIADVCLRVSYVVAGANGRRLYLQERGEAGKKPFFFLFLHSCASRSLLAPSSIALRNTRKTLGKEIAQ